MDARCSLVDTLSAWAAEDRDEKLFEESLNEGKILLQKYPFFVLAHQVIVAPLASLEKDAEALEHIRWLIDRNIAYLTLNVFANLILLASVDNEAQAEARELLFSLEGKLTKGLVEEAVAQIKKFNPSVETVEGLSVLYAEA